MSRNDITLDNIRTHAPSKAYDEGYDRIFGKKRQVPEQCPKCGRPWAEHDFGVPFPICP